MEKRYYEGDIALMMIVVESSNCLFGYNFVLAYFYRDELNGSHSSTVFHMKITKFLDQGNEVLGDQFTGPPH